MEEWTRIGDWDFAPYGNRTISFARSDTGARYEITTREGDPDRRDADQPYPVVTMANTEVGVLSFMVKTISPEGVYSFSVGSRTRTTCWA